LDDKLTIYIKQQEPVAPNRKMCQTTIKEVDRGSKTTVDRSPIPTISVPEITMTRSEREKKRYQCTMTPNTLRSKLQMKLINSFDTNELAGTIASIQITPKETKETR